MSNAVDTALDRVVAIQKEAMLALAAPITVDSVPYYYHWQDDGVYFTNRLGPITVTEGLPDDEIAQDYQTSVYQIIMRMVIGHLTEDYDGNNEAKLKDWIPHLITYFNERPGLQHAAAPVHLDNLWSALVTGCTGFAILQSTGLSVQQLGCEFSLTCTFTEEIELAYV